MSVRTCALAVALLAPYATRAQGLQTADLAYIEDAVNMVQGLVEQLVPLAIAIGLLFFIWGLVQFIASLGDEESKEVGKRRMVWGVMALFVIVSVWGLVGLLNQITGVEQGGDVELPAVPL